MATLRALALCMASAFLACASVVAAESKDRFTILNPTPVESLRDFSTDRPDQTESAYTVDAGHFQVEMDLATFTYDKRTASGADVRSRVWNVAPVNLKVGLTNRIDVQVIADNFVRIRVEDPRAGVVERDSGFGDVTTRLKVNVWGNDEGKTAFAIMPFVKWPLSASGVRNGKTEGGIILPLAVELPRGWSMGAMTEVDFVSDGAGGRDTEFVNSITFGRDLTSKLGGYIEFFTVAGNAPGFKWQGQLDIGFTYALNDTTQLDFGCNFGVTKAAPDYNPFIGISRRF